jgi:Bax protein
MSLSHQHKSPLLSVVQFCLILFLLLLAVLYAPQSVFTVFRPAARETVLPGSIALKDYLESHLGSLSEIRTNNLTPDFLVVNLPEDLSVLSADDHLPLFITLVLSHGHSCNEAILLQRKKLILYLLDEKAGRPISPARKDWFIRLAQNYGAPDAGPGMLLEQVDIIPVSLIIAQAITESGWGTSRFATQGNALYGQHLSKSSGGDFIISRYGEVKVAAFDSLYDSTASYIHNINTGRAYKELREIRSLLRSQQKVLSGYALAQGLEYYSELGDEYVANLRQIIRSYSLDSLDAITPPPYTPVPRIRFLRQEKPS